MEALKEWAVTVRALARGEQIVTLRKGGVREPARHFEVAAERFFLYPTFDHQRSALIRPKFRRLMELAASDAQWSEPSTATAAGGRPPLPQMVTLRAWAKLAATFEIDSTETLNALEDFHIWTHDYADKRLKWKPRHPLQVMVLRVYRLTKPVTVPTRGEYEGCRSWIELDDDDSNLTCSGSPVLSDEDFSDKATAVARAVGATTPDPAAIV